MNNFQRLSLVLVLVLFGGLFTACDEATESDAPASNNATAVSDKSSNTSKDAANTSKDATDTSKDAANTSKDAANTSKETEEYAEYEAVEFTLVNDTARPLLEFYVSEPEEEYWGDDLLPPDEYLGEYSEIQVVIDDGREGCDYDLLAVFGPAADGSVGEGELFQTGVEICDGAVYTYSQGS